MDFLLCAPLFHNNFLQNFFKQCWIWLTLETQFPLQNPPDFGFIQLAVTNTIFFLPDGIQLAFTLPEPDIQGIVSLFELGCIQCPAILKSCRRSFFFSISSISSCTRLRSLS